MACGVGVMSLTKHVNNDLLDKRIRDAEYEEFMSEFAEAHDLDVNDVLGDPC